MLKSHPIKRVLICSATASSLLFTAGTFAKDEPSLSFKTEKLSDTIYMLSGQGGFTGGNVGLSVGADGVAMIDNGVSDVLDVLKTEITKTTTKPIDYMINTHIHGDHIGNNHAFGQDGTRIVSHENLREALSKQKDKDGNIAPKTAFPVLTFNDRMTIHINGDEAKIIHFDHAHTDGDAVVYFKKDNVLHTGDIMFNGRFPYIDDSNGGSLNGVIRALTGISEMVNDTTKIIPGHGALATRDDVLKTVAMLEDAKSLVAKLVSDGKSDEEILKANPLSKYESYSWGFINTERMTKQVITGVRG